VTEAARNSTLMGAETLVGPLGGTATDGSVLPERVGRYRILGLLGVGAVGRVYRARDPETGRVVAMKRVRRHLSRDPRVMERFRREGIAAEGLSHPNLLRVYDVGPDYLVLELVEGESLDERLERRGALAPEEALSILQQMAEALDSIHARGIVHRDVKPSNVLLARDGTVKLSDFGMAHLSWAPITRSGELIGSPAYMAPEHIALGDVEPASDLHALGVVAFLCLTGERPFKGRSVGELLRNVVDQERPSASALEPALPRAVDAVLARAMAKDPDGRFACGRDLVDALARALVAEGRSGRKGGWLSSLGALLRPPI
jgi:serine/threonine protein kinase